MITWYSHTSANADCGFRVAHNCAFPLILYCIHIRYSRVCQSKRNEAKYSKVALYVFHAKNVSFDPHRLANVDYWVNWVDPITRVDKIG